MPGFSGWIDVLNDLLERFYHKIQYNIIIAMRLTDLGGTALCTLRLGKNAIRWTRLSCREFRDHAVRRQFHAPAYNLANFMRTLALPKEVKHWSLTTLRGKFVKIGYCRSRFDGYLGDIGQNEPPVMTASRKCGYQDVQLICLACRPRV